MVTQVRAGFREAKAPGDLVMPYFIGIAIIAGVLWDHGETPIAQLPSWRFFVAASGLCAMVILALGVIQEDLEKRFGKDDD